MPRHISIAKFYDWSDDLYDCVSVSKSKLHDTMNDTPRRFTEKNKLQNLRWCSNGLHVNPGRMFSLERGSLTKGEINIIQGIYQNRGDLSENEALESPRSHKDAWRVGKTAISIRGNRNESVDSVSSYSADFSDTGSSGKIDTDTEALRTSGADSGALKTGEADTEALRKNGADTGKNKNNAAASVGNRAAKYVQGCVGIRDGVGPSTVNLFFSNGLQRTSVKPSGRPDGCKTNRETQRVVSSRTNTDIRLVSYDKLEYTTGDSILCGKEDQCASLSSEVNKMNKDHLVSSSATKRNHSSLFNSGYCIRSVDKETQVTRRIQMEVFLPPVPRDPTDDDVRDSLQEGRPLLERERPMSPTQFKLKRNRLAGSDPSSSINSGDKNS